MDMIGGFFIGLLVAAALYMTCDDSLPKKELYRFCLVQGIKLEDCKTPPSFLHPLGQK